MKFDINVHIFEIPILCCPADKPAVFSTILIYSGSGKHAEKKNLNKQIWNVYIEGARILIREFLTLHTPQATVHSSEVADAWLA